jgi:hypothetical protein
MMKKLRFREFRLADGLEVILPEKAAPIFSEAQLEYEHIDLFAPPYEVKDVGTKNTSSEYSTTD